MNNEHEPQDLAVSEFAEKSHLCTVKCQAIIIASQKGQIDTLTAECERLAEVRNAAGSVDRNAVLEEAAAWLDFYDGKGVRRAEAIRALKSAAPAKPEPAVEAESFHEKLAREMREGTAVFVSSNPAPVAQPLAPSGAVIPHKMSYAERGDDLRGDNAAYVNGWNDCRDTVLGRIPDDPTNSAAQPLAGQDVRAVTEREERLAAFVTRILPMLRGNQHTPALKDRYDAALAALAAPSPVNPKQDGAV